MRKARTGAWSVLTAAACALVVTACGSAVTSSGSSAAGSSSSTGSASARAEQVSLDIQVSHGRNTAIRHFTLRCDPPGGTHPDPAAACRILLHAKDPFGPLPKGIMCPMIMVGTEVATIRGTYFGHPVNITMGKGGCWLTRWTEFGQIFN
jgi:hypothetical protein